MENIMVCKKLITWGGKVCYGKLFELRCDKDATYAVCNKCRSEYLISLKG